MRHHRAFLVVGVRYKGAGSNADDIEVLAPVLAFRGFGWMFVVPLVYLLKLAH